MDWTDKRTNEWMCEEINEIKKKRMKGMKNRIRKLGNEKLQPDSYE